MTNIKIIKIIIEINIKTIIIISIIKIRRAFGPRHGEITDINPLS